MCNAVDRACPPFVQFTCPIKQFNAAANSGVGFIDGPNGEQHKDLTVIHRIGGGMSSVIESSHFWCYSWTLTLQCIYLLSTEVAVFVV